jgi:hypothetical protein
VHEAIRQTSKALSAGLQWGVELDISNCYQSFDGNELTKLIPLPKEVTENIILSAHLNLVPGNIWHFFGPEDDHEGDPITLKAALSSARLGISQGSAASPLVAEAMIAIALENIPNLGVNIAYADNVLLLAKSESDVVSMTEALLAALKAHPVGRLRPRRKVFKPGQPIRYLGHVLSPLNDLVRIDPSERKLQEFVVRAASLIARAQKPSPSPHVRANRIEAAEEYVRSWTASFKLCNGIQKLRDQWLSKIPVA